MITSSELMAMFPHLGFDMECEFVFDEGSFAVSMRGFYTPDELKMMVDQCRHANTVFSLVPRTAEGRAALIQANKRAAELLELRDALQRADYLCVIDGDHIQVRDPVQCSSGALNWTEYRDVILKTDFEVYKFLDARS